MCTAISHSQNGRHFFGRNLDLEFSYHEEVVVTPRDCPFHFRNGSVLNPHHAMIGMATVVNSYPLYYEATNDQGLSMAGLNFPGNAVYYSKASGKHNITPFELIPWILGQCASTSDARVLLQKTNIWKLPFSRDFPLSPLHWMLCDRENCLVLESMTDGLHIFDDPVGVLTNNPPFPYHMYHLSDYQILSPAQAQNRLGIAAVTAYSNGMGAMGLPGDFSSASRFVRAAFVKENSVPAEDPVSQFFHILASVAMPRGSVVMDDGRSEITRYSCCCDTGCGIYYYTTYDNSRITAVDMYSRGLQGEQLIRYPLRTKADIYYEK